jgi:tetratricopeptide (TPR) repeat protein
MSRPAIPAARAVPAAVAFLVLLGSLSACAADPRAATVAPGLDPLRFPDLGARRVTSSSGHGEAQDWFDQGVALFWGFNHLEARIAFEQALARDPALGVAHAYVALTHGPNINDAELTPERARAAHEAAQRAVSAGVSPLRAERALVEAVALRFELAEATDRERQDRAYVDRLRRAHRDLPRDAEIATLFGTALLELNPWNQWNADGTPNEGTLEAVAALEAALELDPLHPGANHLYIHAVEASSEPERAVAAADRLRDLVPGSAHLVHMPSHIDVRTGEWEKAVIANRKAMAADRRYLELRPRDGIYALYGAHNMHFLAYAAMFDGDSETALEGARELKRFLTPEIVASMPALLDGFLGVEDHVLVRFGRFEEILALPPVDEAFPLSRATRAYARGVAFAALGKAPEAESSIVDFERCVAAVPPASMFGNNPAAAVLAVGDQVLRGEVAYRRGEHDAAFAFLREAVVRNDALRYDEPWGWMVPPRHALGALLLEQGRVDEAIAVFEADLGRHPKNGWALRGLADAMERKGELAAAAEYERRVAAAFARADVDVTASCFCAGGG